MYISSVTKNHSSQLQPIFKIFLDWLLMLSLNLLLDCITIPN